MEAVESGASRGETSRLSAEPSEDAAVLSVGDGTMGTTASDMSVNVQLVQLRSLCKCFANLSSWQKCASRSLCLRFGAEECRQAGNEARSLVSEHSFLSMAHETSTVPNRHRDGALQTQQTLKFSSSLKCRPWHVAEVTY